MTATTDVRRYVTILVQWSWLVLLAAVLAGVAAYLISKQQPPVYQASTTLLIDEAPGTNSSADYQSVLTSERRARTYAQLLSTEPLLESVAQTLGLPIGAEELGNAITVQSVRDTQLITVQVRHTDPHTAAQIANTLVTTFAEQTQQRQTARYGASKESLQQQMALLEDQIQRDEEHLERLQDRESIARERLEATLSQNRQSYASLLQSYEQIRLAEAQSTSSVVQVEPAAVPNKPVAPRMLLNTVLAALVGLLGAVGLVFLKEALDDRVKDAEQLAKDTGLPVLGFITRVPKSATTRPVVVAEPRSPVAEAYRALRTNLQFSSVDRQLRTILVTSAFPSEGKSTVAVNLAAVLAQNGRKVVVIDADMRRPVLHKRLELANRSGLSELFVQPKVHLNGSVRPTEINGVSVITSGALPPNPAELVGSEKMTEVLHQVQVNADIVIIDAPPVLPVTDATVLAQRVDGVLVVVRDRQTKVAAVKQTVEQLRRVGANVIGLVVNDIATGRLGNGYRYGRYARYYRYETQEEAPKRAWHAWIRRKAAGQADVMPKEQGTRVIPALHEEDHAT